MLPRAYINPPGHWVTDPPLPYSQAVRCGEMLFTTGQIADLYPLLLPEGARTDRMDNQFLFDFDENGVVDVEDGKWVVGWTRGLENPGATTVRGVAPGTRRGSILAAVKRSTPAILTSPHPPLPFPASAN